MVRRLRAQPPDERSPDRRRDQRRHATLDSCEDRDCPCCRLGEKLIASLDDADVDPGTEMLTMVRVLAITAVASCTRAVDLVELVDALVGQLREDVVMLAGVPKEVH